MRYNVYIVKYESFCLKSLDNILCKVYTLGNVSDRKLFILVIKEVCYHGVLKKFDHHVLYDIIVLYNHS